MKQYKIDTVIDELTYLRNYRNYIDDKSLAAILVKSEKKTKPEA
jgi:hypothetical protein